TLLAAWRSRARMTSRPRSVPPCASFKTTRKKSPPSTKSHRSDMPLECLVIYVLINNAVFVNEVCDASQQHQCAGRSRRDRLKNFGFGVAFGGTRLFHFSFQLVDTASRPRFG